MVTSSAGGGDQAGNGYLGNGSASPTVQCTPEPVVTPAEVDDWVQVSTGSQHTCAIASDDRSWCWGRDHTQQLGNGGAPTQQNSPVPVLATEPSGGPQVIEQFCFSGEVALDDGDFEARARASSFLKVVFTSDTPSVCAVRDGILCNDYTDVAVTPLTTGTCALTATQPGDGSWDPAPPETRSLTILGNSATLALSGLSRTYNGSPKAVTVTTSPPGLSTSILYGASSTPPTNAGSYLVVASLTEPGYPPTQVSGMLVIAKAPQTITSGALGDVEVGHPAVPLSASSTSGLPLGFAASGPCTVGGSSVTVTGVGSCTVTATQAGNPNFFAASPVGRTFAIAVADPMLVVTDWGATFDGSPKPVTVSTTPAGLDTTVTNGGSATVPFRAGSYDVVVTVTETGYEPEQVTGTLVIAKATQTITMAPIPPQVFGGSGFDVIATSTSTRPISLTAVGTCTLVGVNVDATGAGSGLVTASQAGNADYFAATPVRKNVVIAKGSTTTALVGPSSDTLVGTTARFTATVTGAGYRRRRR